MKESLRFYALLVLVVLIWILFAVCVPDAAATQSPRGAETFAAPSISVTLQWTHPGKVQGYRVYLRRSGATYTGFTDAGTNKVIRVSGLQRKTTYKCVVTSYVGSLESARSEELTFRTGNNSNAPAEEL